MDTHWVLLGALKDLAFSANQLWVGLEKDLKVTIKLEDLGMFTCGESNLSGWLD